ncbi:hypothetical protein HETIRDRAFT_448271 [Heterobasidion irregulare TC 32-1]|uniref:Uncharacterized protein n=1 Tax=Heterobasidion irregulare (strain TC 32-1) TaxID=747525 RepID=W4KIW2_HETIT|nr:uncharacterized protein HETIRDRAFT_448271 [Heterobasidion irregulare TC 32-1]ETW85006.1 hypothetical protein HETIRDRAFT_448271 [Heterobasidion irregulare TC 32-1]
MFRLKPLKVYYCLTKCGHVIVKAGELATTQGTQFRVHSDSDEDLLATIRRRAPIPEVLHNCRPGGLVERAADLSDLRWTVEPEAQSGAVLNRGSNARPRPRQREHAADA